MTPPGPPHQRPSPAVAGLRPALAGLLLCGVALTGAAALVGGGEAVAGATGGVVLVAGFFTLGTVTTAVAAAYAPSLSLLVALLTYVLQVLALALVLLALRRTDAAGGALDVRWLAGGVVMGTLSWTTALVWHAMRTVPAGEGAGA